MLQKNGLPPLAIFSVHPFTNDFEWLKPKCGKNDGSLRKCSSYLAHWRHMFEPSSMTRGQFAKVGLPSLQGPSTAWVRPHTGKGIPKQVQMPTDRFTLTAQRALSASSRCHPLSIAVGWPQTASVFWQPKVAWHLAPHTRPTVCQGCPSRPGYAGTLLG